MIDLHLHTTASDGRCTPAELVELACAAGLTVLAVTDHDTMAAVPDVTVLARARGLEVVPGIEITAVERAADVHMLAYFLPPEDPALIAFLQQQRQRRVARVEALLERLGELGMPLDRDAVVPAGGMTGRSIGRPQVARAMVAAGYVATISEAFDRWLGLGGPAFVSRPGPAPEHVIEVVHRAGGIVSLAHPGRTKIDGRIPALRDAGLDAIEVYHSDHAAAEIDRYRELARTLGLLVSGGSDFHGDPARGVRPGTSCLPADEWARLRAAGTRHV